MVLVFCFRYSRTPNYPNSSHLDHFETNKVYHKLILLIVELCSFVEQFAMLLAVLSCLLCVRSQTVKGTVGTSWGSGGHTHL